MTRSKSPDAPTDEAGAVTSPTPPIGTEAVTPAAEEAEAPGLLVATDDNGHERPLEGGCFVRGADGKLTRAEEA